MNSFLISCILQTLNSAGNHFRVVFNPKQPYKKFSPDSALRNTYLATKSVFGLKIALGTDLRIFQSEQKSGVNFF